jgi:hypothetical protein
VILNWKAEDNNISLKSKYYKIFVDKIFSAIPINNHLIIHKEITFKEEIAKQKEFFKISFISNDD